MNRRQLIIYYAAAVLLAGLGETEGLNFYLESEELSVVKQIYERFQEVSKSAGYEDRFRASNTFYNVENFGLLSRRLSPLSFRMPFDLRPRILKAVLIRDLVLINMSGMPEGEASTKYLEGMSLKSTEVEYEIEKASSFFAQSETVDAFALLVVELKIIRETPEHKFIRTSQG